MSHFQIDDSTPSSVWRPPPGQSRGYRGMIPPSELSRPRKGFADLGISMIPESEWPDRARQREKDKTRLIDFARGIGLPCKNQRSTNYCWVFAPTHCCEIIRAKETGRVWSLSPASAGAPIKNFSNSGGWGSQALNYFRENGLNETSDWPDTAISRSYYTSENREKAKRNIVLEYYYLDSWAECVSCIFQDLPVGVGYNWWSHEVTAYDLTTSLDLWIRNSWSMSWGDDGWSTLSGSRKYANDYVVINAMMAA